MWERFMGQTIAFPAESNAREVRDYIVHMAFSLADMAKQIGDPGLSGRLTDAVRCKSDYDQGDCVYPFERVQPRRLTMRARSDTTTE
jgi:hypothetical protein